MSDLSPSNPERGRPGKQDGAAPTDDLRKQLASLPPSSPARALLVMHYQEALQRAPREACIDDFEKAISARPPTNSSSAQLPRDLRIQRDIERCRQAGRGEIIIYLPNFENSYGETQMGGIVSLPIFANSNTENLFERAKKIANGDLCLIEVPKNVSDLDARYTHRLEGIQLGRFQKASELRDFFADDGALSGVATQEEWIAAVTAYYALQPQDLSLLSETELSSAIHLSEDLLRDPQSQIQPIGTLAEFFLSRVPNYTPSWRAVMSEPERDLMQESAQIFYKLTGQNWEDIASDSELLNIARASGRVEEVLIHYCAAIVPEHGQLAYDQVLDRLLGATIPELNEDKLLVVGLVAQKAQNRVNRLFTLTIPKNEHLDLDEDNY